MFINSEISHWGAWSRIQKNFGSELAEIQSAINEIDLTELKASPRHNIYISSSAYTKEFRQKMFDLGWMPNRIAFGENPKAHFSSVDLMKNGVGLEMTFGKFAFVESELFVKFPLFARVAGLQVGIVIVPMKSLCRKLGPGVGTFELLRARIMALDPLPLKYPFTVIGVSERASRSISQVEMTSELDQFLTSTVGYSLREMKALGETGSYDFKERLPESRKIAQQVCAFANGEKGGVILFGVDDLGNVVGIPSNELDSSQLTVINVVQSSCFPTPQIELKVFDVPEDSQRCILAVRVFELPRKPCMTNERVYVRAGASARPATPAEIRRLVLGSAD